MQYTNPIQSSDNPTELGAPKIHCSFCGCSQQQCVTMITAPQSAAICDACVSACVEVIVNTHRKKSNLGPVRGTPPSSPLVGEDSKPAKGKAAPLAALGEGANPGGNPDA
jgi:hypothetical protein